MTDPDRLRRAMVDDLVARRVLTQARWKEAFRAVGREHFVTRFTVPTPDGLVSHDLADDTGRDAALRAVYSDTTLITQWDRGGTATSSSTSPSLMALMLELLDPQPGEAVLEVGTGTGYNGALLAHALGDDVVTSIDVDPDLVAAARAALRRAGYAPTVVCGDGAQGVPERAPFNRLLATCGFDRIPAPWLRQVHPGGVIVVNLSFALVRLVVQDDGSAVGPFGAPAAFMSRRTDSTATAVNHRDTLAITGGDGHTRRTPPVSGLDDPTVTFLRRLHYPTLHQVAVHTEHGTEIRIYEATSGSWARATPEPDGTMTVTSDGPHDLWHNLAVLASAWDRCDRPTPDRYGLTVQPDGTHLLWLDSPSCTIAKLASQPEVTEAQ